MRRLELGAVGLWVAFGLVHAWLIWLIWLVVPTAMGDVVQTYTKWIDPGFTRGEWIGVDNPGVYPPLATGVMALVGIFGRGALTYGIAWLTLVVIVDAVAFAVLLGGRAHSRTRRTAAWWWLGFLLLFGPLALGRLESITTPLAIIAVVVIRRRPALAAALLAAGAWIKIWPGAILAAAAVALRSRVRIIASAAVTSAVVLAAGVLAGGGSALFSFLAGQTTRSLQIESIAATPWMIAIASGSHSARVVWNANILTYEVSGAGVRQTASAMTFVLLALAAVIVALGVTAVVRGADGLHVLGASALALVAAFIVGNAVGSPQFTDWIAPVVVLAFLHRTEPHRRLLAVVVLVIALLTQLIFPWFYDWLVAGAPFLVALLVVKSALWLALLGYGITRLVRLALGGERPVRPVRLEAAPA